MYHIYPGLCKTIVLLIIFLTDPLDLTGQTYPLFKCDTLKILNEHEGVRYSYARFLGESWFNVAVFNSDGYSGFFNPHFSYFVDKDGTWQEYQVSLSSSILMDQFFVVDFDRDGLDDIVTCDGYKVDLMTNISSSDIITFTDPVTMIELDRYIDNIYLYDMNKDGYEDILPDNCKWIGLNNRGKGLILTERIISQEENSYYKLYLISDLNQDGYEDILLEDYGDYLVYPGLGGGEFGVGQSIDWGSSYSTCQFDFDGNGTEEFVALISVKYYSCENTYCAVSFKLTAFEVNDAFRLNPIRSISIDSVEYDSGMRCHIQPVRYNEEATSNLLMTVVLETKTIYYLFNCNADSFVYIESDTSISAGSMPFTRSKSGDYYRINRIIANKDIPSPFPVMIERFNNDIPALVPKGIQQLQANVDTNTVNFTWSNVDTGVIYYDIDIQGVDVTLNYRSDYLRYFGTGWAYTFNRQTRLNRLFTQLRPGSYKAKVIPVNLAQRKAIATDSLQFTIVHANPPAVPDSVKATLELSVVKLEFFMATLYDSIQVYRSDDPYFDSNVLKLGLVDPFQHQYLDASVEADKQYSYRLQAYLNGTSSDFSNIVTINSSGYSMIQYALAQSGFTIGKIIPYDLNNDGYKDLLFKAAGGGPFQVKVQFLPGSESGFGLPKITTIVDDMHINSLHLGDWDGDSHKDLITEVITLLPDNAVTMETIKIWFLNELSVTDTISFNVPEEGGMPLSLITCADFNLDGVDELVLQGSRGISIAWNNGDNNAEIKKVRGTIGSYKIAVYDYNQDGYPDILADNYSYNPSSIYENNKDRSFTKRSTGLPYVNNSATSGHYWDLIPMWFSDDIYPDLLTQRSNDHAMGSYYEIYEYQNDTKRYIKSSLQIDNEEINGKIFPIHFNNDGYIDFIECSNDHFRFWINDQNSSFQVEEYNTGSEFFVENMFNLDTDHDNDLDMFFSSYSNNILYQLLNTESVNNQAPATPAIDSLYENSEGINIEWADCQDDKALEGHIDYLIQLSSDQRLLNLATHSNEIIIKNLPNDTYSLKMAAVDPLEKSSGFSDGYSFEVTLTGIKKPGMTPYKYKLSQNYPNPFNQTTIIKYQVAMTAKVDLSIYNLLGQKVATLVSEKQQAGAYQVAWNAAGFASGVYFYQLKTNAGFVRTKKLILLR